MEERKPEIGMESEKEVQVLKVGTILEARFEFESTSQKYLTLKKGDLIKLIKDAKITEEICK